MGILLNEGALATATARDKPAADDNSIDPLFALMAQIECHECFDTNIAVSGCVPDPPSEKLGYGKIRPCVSCQGKNRAWSTPAKALQTFVWSRLGKPGEVLDHNCLALSRTLTHFTSGAPLLIRHIASYWGIDQRTAKGMIAVLRSDWVLPIGSHKSPPHGAYWITTPEEFLDWSRQYRGQAITSLVTIYRMQRRWFPALYGQTDMAFVEMITDELREAV